MTSFTYVVYCCLQMKLKYFTKHSLLLLSNEIQLLPSCNCECNCNLYLSHIINITYINVYINTIIS